LEVLRECVEEGLDTGDLTDEMTRCLHVAAEHDRAIAVSWLTGHDEASLVGLGAALELKRYPELSELYGDLRTWGLLAPDVVPSGWYAAEALEEAGVLWTRVHYGNHVHLARELASRVGGLDDVVFGIWVPEPWTMPDVDDEPSEDLAVVSSDPRYLLRAYMDGKRHQVLLNGDVDVDVVSVGGVINTLLEIRKHEQRVVVVDGGDQVVFAAPDAIQRAIAAGLFEPVVIPYDPDEVAY
jgi:hypothetical protein